MTNCGAGMNGDVDHAGVEADDGCRGLARGQKGLNADDDAFYVGLLGAVSYGNLLWLATNTNLISPPPMP